MLSTTNPKQRQTKLVCPGWVPVDPPQSRSAPGRSAPRLPQTRSIRPNFWDDPPEVLGRSAPTPISLSIR